MKKVLLYENRKSDPMVWDVSTDEGKERAFRELFQHLRDVWDVYGDWSRGNKQDAERQKSLFDLAQTGDATATERLLRLRNNFEYETWRILEVE